MSDFCIAGEGADFRVDVEDRPKSPDFLTVDKLIERLSLYSGRRHGSDVVGFSYNPGVVTMGPSPFVGIISADLGFDWNNGRVFLQTEKTLGLAGPDLDLLKKQIGRSQETLFYIERQLKDKRLSSDEKVKLALETIDYYKNKA